jgi:hypothetical protein
LVWNTNEVRTKKESRMRKKDKEEAKKNSSGRIELDPKGIKEETSGPHTLCIINASTMKRTRHIVSIMRRSKGTSRLSL